MTEHARITPQIEDAVEALVDRRGISYGDAYLTFGIDISKLVETGETTDPSVAAPDTMVAPVQLDFDSLSDTA